MPAPISFQQNFPDLPPFPDSVPTAPLLRLSLQRLLDGDAAERARLWTACCEVGFFYLDLRDARSSSSLVGESTTSMINGDDFLATAMNLFAAADAIFSLPIEEKERYDYASKGSYFGYKGYGAGVVDALGNKDRNEFFNIAKDDVLEQGERLPSPPALDAYRPALRSFMRTSHAIVTLILDQLDACLGLPVGTLRQMHRLDAISGDQVRWVHAPPQPQQDRKTALGAHTDFGSVTVLFNRLGGLQILPPGQTYTAKDGVDEHAWQYVRPLPGHCVVNLGDAMVKFTRGILRSNVHRVVNPPGDQADWKRTSLVYFARPEDEVLLAPVQGSTMVDERKEDNVAEETISSKEWILRRALGRRGVGDFTKSEGTETTSAPARGRGYVSAAEPTVVR